MNSRFNESDKGKTIDMVNPTQIVATMSSRLFIIPKRLENIHAYHPEYQKLIDHNLKLSIQSMETNQTNKIKLLKKQKGLCPMCNSTLLDENGEFRYDGSTHIHHKKEIRKGGSKANLNNLMLVHKECHVTHHTDKP